MLSDKSIVRERGDGRLQSLIYKARHIIAGNKRVAIANQIRETIGNIPFTIISSNCIAGYFYHDAGREFSTPTINLAFDGEDFVRFCEDLPKYINGKLEFVKYDNVSYPVARIDDVEIRFIHYRDEQECIETWSRRSARIVWNNIFIITTDRDGMRKNELLKRFDMLPYKNKIMFTAKDRPDYDWEICVPQFRNRFQVKVVTNLANLHGQRYYETCFDMAKWIKENSQNV